MEGFGVHTSMWTMNWDRDGAERAVADAVRYEMDFIEIALLNPRGVDIEHTRNLLERNEMRAICSLGLPEHAWASRSPDKAIDHLEVALATTSEMGM